MAAGAFLEHVTYAGNRYGTLRSEIDRIIAAGRWPLVEIELAGRPRGAGERARGGRHLHRAALALGAGAAAGAARHRQRGRRSRARLATSRVELEAMGEFDHVIVNERRRRARSRSSRALVAAATGEGPMAEVLLGVSGGIAAYKSVDVLRILQRRGHGVRVVMTRAARRFVGPATFAALSGHPVGVDLFGAEGRPGYDHLDLARGRRPAAGRAGIGQHRGPDGRRASGTACSARCTWPSTARS